MLGVVNQKQKTIMAIYMKVAKPKDGVNMRNTIITLENMLGKKVDFRICENCGHLTDISQMAFNHFSKEHWFCMECIAKSTELKR